MAELFQNCMFTTDRLVFTGLWVIIHWYIDRPITMAMDTISTMENMGTMKTQQMNNHYIMIVYLCFQQLASLVFAAYVFL